MLSFKDRILLLQSSTKSEKAVQLCKDASRVCGNKMLESTLSCQLLENLDSEANDPAVRQFIDRETKLNKVQNLGVKESYQALCQSELMQYAVVRPILERMRIEIYTIPEHVLAEGYCAQLDNLSWNAMAKSHAVKIRKAINESKEDIDICNFMYEAQQTNSYLLPAFKNELDNYFVSRSTESRNALLEKIKPYMFDQKIANFYKLVESKQEGMHIHADGSVNIEKIYSPVISKNGATIFCNEGKFFAKTKTDLTMLSDAQVRNLPSNFVTLCQNLNARNVQINESKIDVFTNTKTVSIFPESKTLQVNGNPVDYNIFARSFVNEGLIYGSSVNTELKQICSIYENANTIVEIDFGKHVTSNTYKGHSADIYKFGNNISIYEMNSEFGTSQFIKKATATQARQLLVEHLNYDIKDSFCEMSSKERAKISMYESEKATFEKNLEHLTARKNQILEAMKVDAYLNYSEDIKMLLEALNLESSKLQDEILTRTNLIKSISSTSAVQMFEEEDFANQADEVDNSAEAKFQNIKIEDAPEKIYHEDKSKETKKEGTGIKAGDQIQMKNGALGTVQGFENGGDDCILLMHDGKTVRVEKEFLNEITVVKTKSSAINPEITRQNPNGAMSVQVMEGEKVCTCADGTCVCKEEDDDEVEVKAVVASAPVIAGTTPGNVCTTCGQNPCVCNKNIAPKSQSEMKREINDTDIAKTPSSSDPKPMTFELKDTTSIPPQGFTPEVKAEIKTVQPSIVGSRVEAQLVDDLGNVVMDKILVEPEQFTAAGENDKITYMANGNSQDVFTTAKKYVKMSI